MPYPYTGDSIEDQEELTLQDVQPWAPVEEGDGTPDGVQTSIPDGGVLTSSYNPGSVQSSDEYVAPEVYSPGEKGTVQGQLTGILAKDNPYIQAARNRGVQFAQSRGLLNSSIAAGAGEKSAIESALPIAQQDASVVSQAGLQKQAFGEEAALTDIKAGASSQLSEQEAKQRSDLDAQQQEGANFRQLRELELNERLSKADVSLSEKNTIANQMATLGDNFQAKVAGIQVDPGLSSSAKTEAIRTLQNAYESNIKSIGSIYGIEIDWGIEDISGGEISGVPNLSEEEEAEKKRKEEAGEIDFDLDNLDIDPVIYI